MKLPLLILVKPYKQVMEISKFFKQGTKLIEKKEIGKLYAQVLSPKTRKNPQNQENIPEITS